MKQICCLDCVHCHEYWEVFDSSVIEHYTCTCDAGTVMKEIEDPEKVIDCPDFEQYIEDI